MAWPSPGSLTQRADSRLSRLTRRSWRRRFAVKVFRPYKIRLNSSSSRSDHIFWFSPGLFAPFVAKAFRPYKIRLHSAFSRSDPYFSFHCPPLRPSRLCEKHFFYKIRLNSSSSRIDKIFCFFLSALNFLRARSTVQRLREKHFFFLRG